jgi:hypothetical protein
MKLAQIRRHALSMPEVSEQPHFEMSSLRVRGKIFVTFPADGKHLHVFVAEPAREMVIAMYPEFLEKLTWGRQGRRVARASAAGNAGCRQTSCEPGVGEQGAQEPAASSCSCAAARLMRARSAKNQAAATKHARSRRFSSAR